jgi:hypothetical protein
MHSIFTSRSIWAGNSPFARRRRVLSKDTGFDPLVRHFAGLGHGCRRVSLPRDAFPSAGKSAKTSKMDSYGLVLELLGKEKHRPRKRTVLVGKLTSYLPQVSAEERADLLARLVSEGKVTERDGELRYPL